MQCHKLRCRRQRAWLRSFLVGSCSSSRLCLASAARSRFSRRASSSRPRSSCSCAIASDGLQSHRTSFCIRIILYPRSSEWLCLASNWRLRLLWAPLLLLLRNCIRCASNQPAQQLRIIRIQLQQRMALLGQQGAYAGRCCAGPHGLQARSSGSCAAMYLDSNTFSLAAWWQHYLLSAAHGPVRARASAAARRFSRP